MKMKINNLREMLEKEATVNSRLIFRDLNVFYCKNDFKFGSNQMCSGLAKRCENLIFVFFSRNIFQQTLIKVYFHIKLTFIAENVQFNITLLLSSA